MKLSYRVFNQTSSKFTARIIFQLILVSVGVKSGCIEEDCTDESITVVNASTGECVTCFPCDCSDGVPSVPCGSTVPLGTDIHCVHLPDPALVSKASAYSTSKISGRLTLLAPSPSISLWSLVPSTSNTHSVVVQASSTKTFVSSSSSADDSDFIPEKPMEGPKVAQDKPKKQGSNTSVYTVGCIFLIITLAAIACRLQKMKSEQAQLPVINRYTNSNQEPSSLISSDQDSDICTVHPETNRAVLYSRARSKDDQKSNRGNDNQHFQPDPALVDAQVENAVAVPSSLDTTNPEGHQSYEDPKTDDENLLDLSSDPSICPDHSTETSNGFPFPTNCPSFVTRSVNILLQTPSTLSQPQSSFIPPTAWQHLSIRSGIASDLDQQSPVKWSALSQRDKYNTKMKEVPFLLLHNICLSLDVPRVGDGKDVRDFADKLGVKHEEFERLQQAAAIEKTTTTSVIIKGKFLEKKPSGTVHDFVSIMADMGRSDIVDYINNWNE